MMSNRRRMTTEEMMRRKLRTMKLKNFEAKCVTY
jgi:hypothetical protein